MLLVVVVFGAFVVCVVVCCVCVVLLFVCLVWGVVLGCGVLCLRCIPFGIGFGLLGVRCFVLLRCCDVMILCWS